MTLIKKNLKTVKNKLLCELEDYLLDSILPQISTGKLNEEFANEFMQVLIKAIKENDVRFGIICYTDENGNDLKEEDLKEVPLKLKVIQECLPEIMEIMSDYFQEGASEEVGKPKAKTIRKR
jgi:hypothetical protein